VRLSLFLLTIGLLVAGNVVVAQPLWADEGGTIELVEQTVESEFPDGVKFSLTARSPDEIDDVRVFFRKVSQRSSSYNVVEFKPGNLISGEFLLPSGSGGSFIPIGTGIEFSFEIRDKAGRVFRTPQQEYIYRDNRFDWLEVSDGLITVDYYSEFVKQRAQTVLEAAHETMERMGAVLGVEPTEPLRIVNYNNYRHMAEALPFRSQAVQEQLRVEGMAFAEERVLLVLGSAPTIQGITSHEFTHLLVAEAAGRAYNQVPAWLNEGLAEYGNLDPTDSYDAALRYGIFTRRLKPLWYLNKFGGEPDDIVIAYGQGSSVVRYMIEQYGTSKIAELFQVLQDTLDIDVALERIYGFDQHGLDGKWRLALGIEPLPPAEELERQLQLGGTLLPESTSMSPPTATSVPIHEPTLGNSAVDSREPGNSPGCNVPHPNRLGGIAPDVGVLLLLSGPLAMVSIRAIWRRRPLGPMVMTKYFK
jgi:hypothetical protein